MTQTPGVYYHKDDTYWFLEWIKRELERHGFVKRAANIWRHHDRDQYTFNYSYQERVVTFRNGKTGAEELFRLPNKVGGEAEQDLRRQLAEVAWSKEKQDG